MADVEHNERITRLEAEMGFFRTNFDEVKKLLQQLAEDMHKLALSDAEQREYRRTIDRMSSRLDAKDTEMVRVWERLEKIEDNFADQETQKLKDELTSKNRWLFEIGKILLVAAVAVVGAHYGVKVLP